MQRLAIDGVEIIVCGVGDGEKTRRELGTVVAGCARILGERTRADSSHSSAPGTGLALRVQGWY